MMESKKDMALAYLMLASSGRVGEAYEKYKHPKFQHHNPYFRGDRESLMLGMVESMEEFPDKVFEAVRALQDDDLVAVHGRVRLKEGMPEYALMHIFRFYDGLIIDAWEVSQEVPQESPNANGMF